MRIEVVERLPGTDRVRFRCAGGEALARWAGDGPPASGPFFVEVDIPGEVRWADVELPAGARPGLRQDGDRTTVTGVVEGLDELGVLTLRIPDGVVLVDTAGQAPTGIAGRTVRMTVPALDLTPFSA